MQIPLSSLHTQSIRSPLANAAMQESGNVNFLSTDQKTLTWEYAEFLIGERQLDDQYGQLGAQNAGDLFSNHRLRHHSLKY